MKACKSNHFLPLHFMASLPNFILFPHCKMKQKVGWNVTKPEIKCQKKQHTHRQNVTNVIKCFQFYLGGKVYLPILSIQITNRANTVYGEREGGWLFYTILDKLPRRKSDMSGKCLLGELLQ